MRVRVTCRGDGRLKAGSGWSLLSPSSAACVAARKARPMQSSSTVAASMAALTPCPTGGKGAAASPNSTTRPAAKVEHAWARLRLR